MGSYNGKKNSWRWEQVTISCMVLVTGLRNLRARHLHSPRQIACVADKLDHVIGEKYHAWLTMRPCPQTTYLFWSWSSQIYADTTS